MVGPSFERTEVHAPPYMYSNHDHASQGQTVLRSALSAAGVHEPPSPGGWPSHKWWGYSDAAWYILHGKLLMKYTIKWHLNNSTAYG